MTGWKTVGCAALALAGCYPQLEPRPEPPKGSGVELSDCATSEDCAPELDCAAQSCQLPCELQHDCSNSAAEVPLCAEGHCQPSAQITCAVAGDCGAMGWCLIVAEGCEHGDPASCEGGTEGTCMPDDARHCRQGAEVTDCYALGMVCCERVASGAHECALADDCASDYVLVNPKALQ